MKKIALNYMYLYFSIYLCFHALNISLLLFIINIVI